MPQALGADRSGLLRVSPIPFRSRLALTQGTAQFDISINGLLALTQGPDNKRYSTADFQNDNGLPITINGSPAPAQSPLGTGLSVIVVTTEVVNDTINPYSTFRLWRTVQVKNLARALPISSTP